MPDANGKIKGTGWSRAGEAAHERIFGNAASQQRITTDDIERRYLPRGPASLHRPLRVGDLPESAFQNPFAKHARAIFDELRKDASPLRVPTERTPEVEHLADRTAAEEDGWSPEDYDQERSAGPPVRFEHPTDWPVHVYPPEHSHWDGPGFGTF